MPQINKAKETMTSRERVLKTFAYQKTDRVPINYNSNPIIHGKVAAALGCAGNYEAFLQTLGVDFRSAWIDYKGPLLYKEISGLSVNPMYGYYTRWVENKYGGYNDFCNFPLQGAEDEEIDAFPFPSPDDFDYEEAIARISNFDEYAVYCGHPGIGCIINSIGFIMGMEDILVNLQLRNEATLGLIDRKLDMELGILERLLDKAGGRVDFMWLGEDVGTQHAPMISLELYRELLRPRHQKFVDLAKSYNIPVMMHTCGSSSWVYEDFIAMGITAVDTLQPEAAQMSPEYLVEHFGGRLSFHGCISTTGPLAFGTADDTVQYCRNILEIMKPKGGYHFSPTHQIQDNTPVENVIAMYQTAHIYGAASQ